MGRVARKIVRDTPLDENSTRFEVDYTYDGRGQLTRERIWRYDVVSEMMVVTQDIQTTFDLGRNPTGIKFSDNSGWAYTETRSYARGYQLVDFSTSNATGVSVTASGSYTYDTNNNLLTTKLLAVTRGTSTLATRRAWTFTYDNKNRLITYTNTTVNDVGNLWYDGRGRVWQRWQDDAVSGAICAISILPTISPRLVLIAGLP